MRDKDDTFGARMKQYEALTDAQLMRRLPVIVRCDGKGFHQVTKNLPKPCYDFAYVMASAMVTVAKGAEGCVFGYTQSDEVTFVLKNDQSIMSQPLFDNRVQKLCSTFASAMTYWFNRFWCNTSECVLIGDYEVAKKTDLPPATFDARVYTVPNIVELMNVIWWRQKDCTRNAVSLVAYAEFGRKYGKKTAQTELYKKKTNQKLELLFQEFGIDFYTDYPKHFQRGYACYKKDKEVNGTMRSRWTLDGNLPLIGKEPDILLDAYEPFDEEDKKQSEQ